MNEKVVGVVFLSGKQRLEGEKDSITYHSSPHGEETEESIICPPQYPSAGQQNSEYVSSASGQCLEINKVV